MKEENRTYSSLGDLFFSQGNLLEIAEDESVTQPVQENVGLQLATKETAWVLRIAAAKYSDWKVHVRSRHVV